MPRSAKVRPDRHSPDRSIDLPGKVNAVSMCQLDSGWHVGQDEFHLPQAQAWLPPIPRASGPEQSAFCICCAEDWRFEAMPARYLHLTSGKERGGLKRANPRAALEALQHSKRIFYRWLRNSKKKLMARPIISPRFESCAAFPTSLECVFHF